MNIFDILIIAFLVIGISVGLYRGFFKEFVGTVGLFVAAIIANIVSPYAGDWLGDSIMSDQKIQSIILWVVVFLLLLFVMNRVAWLLGKVFSSLNLGWANRLAGGFFSFIKFALIAALVISIFEFVAAHVDGLKYVEAMQGSRIIPLLHKMVEVVMPWFSEHILGPSLQLLK